MKSPIKTFRYLFSHPLTKKDKLSSSWRLMKWQMAMKFFPFPVLYPFVESTHLLVEKGMTGATGNVYAGLHEFSEMGFLLHLLRPGDVFGDIGANVGAFTVLASGVAGSRSLAAEPVLSTFLHLKHNVSVNNIESLVELQNCGVGSESGTLHFTSELDTVNHVIAEGESKPGKSIQVEIKTLDDLFSGQSPLLLKIDVEGFEMSVLRGASRIMREPGLKAIIVELNGACRRYNINEEDIHQLLLANNFKPVSYSPLERTLAPLTTFDPHGNTIYIKDEDWVRERVTTARKVKVLNHMI